MPYKFHLAGVSVIMYPLRNKYYYINGHAVEDVQLEIC